MALASVTNFARQKVGRKKEWCGQQRKTRPDGQWGQRVGDADAAIGRIWLEALFKSVAN